MSIRYEILKRLVSTPGIKKRWIGKSTDNLLENRRKSNAKNRIPDLKDNAFQTCQAEVMGFPVLRQH